MATTITSKFVKDTLEGKMNNTAAYAVYISHSGILMDIYYTFDKYVMFYHGRWSAYASDINKIHTFFRMHDIREINVDPVKRLFEKSNPTMAVELDDLTKIKRPNKISYYVYDPDDKPLYFRCSHVQTLVKSKKDVRLQIVRVNEDGGYAIMFDADNNVLGLIMGFRKHVLAGG